MQKLNGYAFLILDLNLPDGCGLSILRRLRVEKPWMKVVVFTGSDDPALLQAVDELRPDAIFRKPVDFNEMVQWLDAAAVAA
jgi:DNA-binding NarL/FixJ family response regulator